MRPLRLALRSFLGHERVFAVLLLNISCQGRTVALTLALPLAMAFIVQTAGKRPEGELSLRHAGTVAGSHRQWRPRVRIFAGPANYVGVGYAAPPRAGLDYLHYSGDPLALHLTVGNTGADDVRLDFGPPPGQLFAVRLEGESSSSARPLHPSIVGKPSLGPDRNEKQVRATGMVVLPAQRQLAMTVELRGAEHLPAGDHVLVFSLARACRPECDLTTGRYAFELRAATSHSDRNEWLQRRIYSEMARRNYSAAQEHLRQLTERAPDRGVTWITASRLAVARRRWCDVATAVQRVISIAEAGTDPTFRPGEGMDLRNQLEEARKRCK